MFRVGDKVKFKKSSIDSGMIDATEDDVFEVSSVFTTGVQLLMGDYFQVFAFCHLEHVKEEIMEEQKIENQPIDWEVGHTVWCVIFGKGVVVEIEQDTDYKYPVKVHFEDGTREEYSLNGRMFETGFSNRSLFFSEPKIEAELFPPKKPFTPTLKEGDVILAKDYRGFRVIRVSSEDEHFVYNEDGTGFGKSGWEFRTLGEEIIFN